MMDRLPLVQALTAAGLERAGAEQVATALGDAIEASVATKSDVARLEAQSSRLEALTKSEVLRLEGTIAHLEVSVRADLAALETRMTLRLGGIVVTAMGVLFALLRFTGHQP